MILEKDNTNNNIVQQPQKRKRGRPRKNQVIDKQEKKQKGKKPVEKKKLFKTIDDNEEEIILHIPGLSLSDVQNLKATETKTVTEKSSSSPQDTDIFTIADISGNYSSSEDDDNKFGIVIENDEIIKKLKEKDVVIKKLEDEIQKYRDILNENLISGIDHAKVTKMDINLISTKTGKSLVKDKTDIACWWCTCNFNTPPCFIPEKVVDNTYYVFGCFCSFNCAASYNVSIDDYKVWDRYSLIKKLYNTIYENNKDILVAPPRESLKKFGGPLSIEEFRRNHEVVKKKYRMIMPPMVSIVPFIEESYVDNSKFKKLKIMNGEDDYVLKRSKPLPNTKNTLQNFFEKV